MSAAVDAVLARHRAVSIAALTVLALMAWGWLLLGAGTGMVPGFSLVPAAPSGGAMPEMDMPGMDMPGMAMPGGVTSASSSGGTVQGLATFSMWWIMMVAMMLPSAAPTILLHARAAAGSGVGPAPASGSFLAGYLGVWGVFSALAAVLQLAFQHVGLVALDAMASTSRQLSGAILVIAGMYQLSPLKEACLRHCRSPAQFLARHYRPGPLGALRMGALHGTICVGCCWHLMALLFVGGVMNLVWIAALTLMVAAEKLLRFGRAASLAWGAAILGGGAWLLLA